MPELDGLAATARIRQQLPQVQMVMFSLIEGIGGEQLARQAGASAHVAKGAPVEQLCAPERLATGATGRRQHPGRGQEQVPFVAVLLSDEEANLRMAVLADVLDAATAMRCAMPSALLGRCSATTWPPRPGWPSPAPSTWPACTGGWPTGPAPGPTAGVRRSRRRAGPPRAAGRGRDRKQLCIGEGARQ
jgi:CheY-like chemotaxis protein